MVGDKGAGKTSMLLEYVLNHQEHIICNERTYLWFLYNKPVFTGWPSVLRA